MSNTNQIKTVPAKSKMVKILGQMVREGTKKHAILVQQVRHFNDLAKYE